MVGRVSMNLYILIIKNKIWKTHIYKCVTFIFELYLMWSTFSDESVFCRLHGIELPIWFAESIWVCVMKKSIYTNAWHIYFELYLTWPTFSHERNSILVTFNKFIIYYKRSLLSNDQQLFNMPLRARMHQPTIMDGGGPNLTVW